MPPSDWNHSPQGFLLSGLLLFGFLLLASFRVLMKDLRSHLEDVALHDANLLTLSHPLSSPLIPSHPLSLPLTPSHSLSPLLSTPCARQYRVRDGLQTCCHGTERQVRWPSDDQVVRGCSITPCPWIKRKSPLPFGIPHGMPSGRSLTERMDSFSPVHDASLIQRPTVLLMPLGADAHRAQPMSPRSTRVFSRTRLFSRRVPRVSQSVGVRARVLAGSCGQRLGAGHP